MQLALNRVLYIWSKFNEDISYYQGLNDLASVFFVVYASYKFGNVQNDGFARSGYQDMLNYLPSIEADVYWSLDSLISSIRRVHVFHEGGVYAVPMVEAIEKLTNMLHPELVEHFNSLGITFVHFSFRWMLCFMSREVSTLNLLTLWDRYIVTEDGFAKFHIYFCAAYLSRFATKLIEYTDMADIIILLQQPKTKAWKEEDMKSIMQSAKQIEEAFPLSSL